MSPLSAYISGLLTGSGLTASIIVLILELG
jgi:hypothetical protein